MLNSSLSEDHIWAIKLGAIQLFDLPFEDNVSNLETKGLDCGEVVNMAFWKILD